MFGKVHRSVVLAVIMWTAIARVEETETYSPWCSCKVPVQLTIMLPRPAPCTRHHRKHDNKRLYLVLLLLMAGDVELNPGPTQVEKTYPEDILQEVQNTPELKCAVCNMLPETMMLRSRVIPDTLVECSKSDCTRFAHHHCLDESLYHKTEWTCDKHCRLAGKPQACPPDLSANTVSANASDNNIHSLLLPKEQEPTPGPSFVSASMMDVMEALRLTQLKIDKVSNDLQALTLLFHQFLPQNDLHRSPTPARHHPNQSCQQADSGAKQHTRQINTRSISESKLSVIGDSNVRRLQEINGQSNISFKSLPGATTEQLEQMLSETPDEALPSTVVIHAGTNDLACEGSERVVANLIRLAQRTKSRPGVQRVCICSVTPRRDMGSFIFSRSDSVNNRLDSLCKQLPGIMFIDLRKRLESSPFGGLTKDALHYNKAGSSYVLREIIGLAITFLK